MHSKELLDNKNYNISLSETKGGCIVISAGMASPKDFTSEVEDISPRQLSSIKRSINKLNEICRNNEFDYMVSISPSSSLARYNLKELGKTITNWVKAYNKSRHVSLRFVCVKAPFENGGYHCHMLVSGIYEDDLIPFSEAHPGTHEQMQRIDNGEEIYDWVFKHKRGEYKIGIMNVTKISVPSADGRIYTREKACGYLNDSLSAWYRNAKKCHDIINRSISEAEKDLATAELIDCLDSGVNLITASQGLAYDKKLAKHRTNGKNIKELLVDAEIRLSYGGAFGFCIVIDDPVKIDKVLEWFNYRKRRKGAKYTKPTH